MCSKRYSPHTGDFVVTIVVILLICGSIGRIGRKMPFATAADAPATGKPSGSVADPDAQKDWSLEDLTHVAQDEMARIDQVVGFKTAVKVDDDLSGTLTTYAGGTRIDAKELRAILANAKAKKFREVVRLILAHETGHQLQFREYGPDCYANADAQARRIFECQADILAGKYLSESLAGQEDIQAAVVDALQVMFVIGDRELAAAADHPDHEARRTAVRRGMAAGQITKGLRLPQTPELQASMQFLTQKLNLRLGETDMQWSRRQAERIIHCDRQASVDLNFSQEQINFNTDPKNPVVTYSVNYTNSGSRPIRLDMEFRSDWVDRKDSHDTLRSLLWMTNNYAVILQPGETRTASATMLWGDASGSINIEGIEKLMPRLVSPPDDVALWSCVYVGTDGKPLQTNDSQPALGHGLLAAPEGVDKRRLNVLQRIAATTDFKQLRAGPGTLSDDDTQYPCDPQIPDVGTTQVSIPRDGSSSQVWADQSFQGDGHAAQQAYAALVRDIKAAFPQKTLIEESGDANHTEDRSVHIDGDATNPDVRAYYKCRISRDGATKRFAISVWIMPPKP